MPLIEIRTMAHVDVDRAAISRALNAAVADAVPCRLDAVWSTWQTIDGPFVRGDEVATAEAPGTVGPIVHVYHHRTAEQVERVVEAIEVTLATALGVDRETVFVTTQPVAVDDPTVPPDGG